MATFYEDETSPDTTPFERRVLRGCPSFPHANALLGRLRAQILTDPVSHAVARAVVVMGTAGEPGAAYFTLFSRRHLATRFRSKRNQLEIDELLAPYYGNVVPALDELRGQAVDTALADYWLRWFRTDSGIYRVRVVAAMCVGACIEELRRG